MLQMINGWKHKSGSPDSEERKKDAQLAELRVTGVVDALASLIWSRL